MAKLTSTLQKSAALPKETDCVEFMHNFHLPEEIDERIYALAKSAIILGGYDMSYGQIIRQI